MESRSKPYPFFAVAGFLVFSILGWLTVHFTMPAAKLGAPRYAGEYLEGVILMGVFGMSAGAFADGLRSGLRSAGLRTGAVLAGGVLGFFSGTKLVEWNGLASADTTSLKLSCLSILIGCATFLFVAVAVDEGRLSRAESSFGTLVLLCVLTVEAVLNIGGFNQGLTSSEGVQTMSKIGQVLVGVSLLLTFHGFWLERRAARHASPSE
jgi:hypothetical protein